MSSTRHASGSGVVSSPSRAKSSEASPRYTRVLPPTLTRSNSVRSPVESPIGLLGLAKLFSFIVWKTLTQVGLEGA
jgi:hypothetical protein